MMIGSNGIASLDGARAKLDRAGEHFKALKAELETSNIYPEAVKIDTRPNGEVTVTSPIPSFDQERLIVGDLIYNMRAALDYLVWQLVILEGSHAPGRHTAFPIEETCKSFIRNAVQGTKTRKPHLHGLDPAGGAFAIIESSQPYHSPEDAMSLLLALSKLSNFDKHRALSVQVTFLTDPKAIKQQIQWNPSANLLNAEYATRATLEDDAVLARLTFDPAGPAPEVHVKGKVSITPTFANGPTGREGTIAAPVGALRDMLARVTGIVDEASDLF